ncbi:MAG: hypothetical protein AB7O32_03675 [Vicinamibacterales bacterium]
MVTDPAHAGCPTVADVEATAAMAEPILRNLRITVSYGRLSNAFAGTAPGGANWCTFATWASRQAGCTIRKEDIARVVADRLRSRFGRTPILREVHRVLGLSADRLAAVAGELSQGLPGIDRASEAVARGNLKVFEEIARVFAAVLEEGGPGPDAVIAALRPGPPPEGQDLLKSAFQAYREGAAAASRSQRAQCLLLGNVLIGFHEQTRLQPEIRAAMDSALLDVADTRRRVLERLDAAVAAGPLGPIRTGAGTRVLNRVADHVSEELREVARLVTTDRLMSIGLSGDRTLRLGRDAAIRFPDSLASITDDRLSALLQQFDRTPDSPAGSGAVDWSDLPQRLHFIADFFRAYHEDAGLFEPPFAPAHLTAIAEGRVPEPL